MEGVATLAPDDELASEDKENVNAIGPTPFGLKIGARDQRISVLDHDLLLPEPGRKRPLFPSSCGDGENSAIAEGTLVLASCTDDEEPIENNAHDASCENTSVFETPMLPGRSQTRLTDAQSSPAFSGRTVLCDKTSRLNCAAFQATVDTREEDSTVPNVLLPETTPRLRRYLVRSPARDSDHALETRLFGSKDGPVRQF